MCNGYLNIKHHSFIKTHELVCNKLQSEMKCFLFYTRKYNHNNHTKYFYFAIKINIWGFLNLKALISRIYESSSPVTHFRIKASFFYVNEMFDCGGARDKNLVINDPRCIKCFLLLEFRRHYNCVMSETLIILSCPPGRESGSSINLLLI